jgi:hypothetical protein
MSKHDTLSEYLRHARTDVDFRAHLLESARYARAAFGWSALSFAVLAAGPAVYDGLRYGVWISCTCMISAACCVFSVLMHDKFGDRVAMLTSMEGVPNQSPEPVPTAVTPPAGQESRHA